jgi:hypothetical protein
MEFSKQLLKDMLGCISYRVGGGWLINDLLFLANSKKYRTLDWAGFNIPTEEYPIK